jgi:hypothetical protein
MAWMLAVPELKNILEQVIGGPSGPTVNQNTFNGMIRSTNWYKNSTQAMRDYVQLMGEDPATAKAQLSKQTADLATEASIMGVKIPPDQLQEMATQSLAYTWDKQMTDQALYAEAMRQTFAGTAQGGSVSATPAQAGSLTGSGADSVLQGDPNVNGRAYNGPLRQINGNPFGGGTLADYYDKIQAQAAQYMITVSPATATQWAIGQATGQLDPTAIEGNLVALALGKYPTMKTQIEQGMTPSQIFDPIKQEVSKTLEVSPDAINWQDPKYQQVFQYSPPKGAPDAGVVRPMTITEAVNWARQQPEWMNTQQGNQAGASLVKSIGNLMGVIKN